MISYIIVFHHKSHQPDLVDIYTKLHSKARGYISNICLYWASYYSSRYPNKVYIYFNCFTAIRLPNRILCSDEGLTLETSANTLALYAGVHINLTLIHCTFNRHADQN